MAHAWVQRYQGVHYPFFNDIARPSLKSLCMIPSIRAQGIIPPFIGADPTFPPDMSPYLATMPEFVTRFAVSNARRDILVGLLDYRQELAARGFQGFQWLSGSFVEDIESLENRHPRDVDVVSFVTRPIDLAQDDALDAFLNSTAGYRLFDAATTKAAFHCDAYLVDLNEPSELIVDNTRYWTGLFSHQRSTYLWKGMIAVEIDLQHDAVARSIIQAAANSTSLQP